MKKHKRLAKAFLIVCSILAIPLSGAVASDIDGLWNGTWQIPGDPAAGVCGQSNIFSVSFHDTPQGYMAAAYIPSFGLFDQWLPATITSNGAGVDVSIGVPGLIEISGRYDGQFLSGNFSAYSEIGGVLIAAGTWYAEKSNEEEPLPGQAPGPPCSDLPPLFCTGDAAYCSELVPFEPGFGEGYIDQCNSVTIEEDQCYRFIRRDLMMLIKYAAAKVACKTWDWDFGSFTPLGLLDMSEADGATPGTSFGYLRHPPGTHTNGTDIDTAYYQLYAEDNRARPVGVHHAKGYDENGNEYYYDAYHLLMPPYALDKWRTALYISYLAEHPRLRVVGVDGQIGLVLEEAFDTLAAMDWLTPEFTDSIPLAYEVEDTGQYWFLFHHNHTHISINPVVDIVSRVRVTPRVLHHNSRGRFVTARIELVEGFDVQQIDRESLALILSGEQMVWARPEHVRISDFNRNGTADITARFHREDVLSALENGKNEIAVTGLVDGVFFQETSVIRVWGKPFKKLKRHGFRHHVPFFRPGGRSMDRRDGSD